MGLFRAKTPMISTGTPTALNGKGNPKAPAEPLPSPPPVHRHTPRDKRMDYRMRCWLLVEKNDWVLETSTLNMSKSGLLVRSLKPVPVGQSVLILLIDKPHVTAAEIRANKFVMKGKVVRVEKLEAMCRMGIQITLGRVNPVVHEKSTGETKYWWTRHWQE